MLSRLCIVQKITVCRLSPPLYRARKSPVFLKLEGEGTIEAMVVFIVVKAPTEGGARALQATCVVAVCLSLGSSPDGFPRKVT